MKTAEEIVAEMDPVDDVTVEENVFDDPLVQRVLSRTIENDEIPHLEVALMELALWDLYLNSDAVEDIEKRVRKDMTTNYSRALAKTYFKMRESGKDVDELISKYLRKPVAKAEKGSRWITIPTYERTDGTVVEEHKRQLPTDMTRRSLEELKEIADEVKQATESDYGRRQLRWGKGREILDKDPAAAQMIINEWNKQIDRAKEVLQDAPKHMREGEAVRRAERDAYSEQESRDKRETRTEQLGRAANLLDDKTIADAGKKALTGETWGSRVVNVADYFSSSNDQRLTSTVKFAARAIKDYGPLTGMRIAHAYMRYGGYDVPIQTDHTGTRTTEQGDVIPPVVSKDITRDWAIGVLTSRLAREDTYNAEAKPPSEGFIIDGDGNVLAHAIGRGMDHYIPFNTRHLKKMRKTDRVEFIRTRMVGGPTVEDLHAAMMMGVDKLTVVSNSGTYSVDFTKRSHGVKLEHFQVLTRYQEILDEYQVKGENRKNRRRLDHDGYVRALQSISDEFPLHINFKSELAMPGTWAEKHDYVQPTNRLMDQLKRLFGLNIEDRNLSEAARGKNAPGTRSVGITGGKRISDWWTQELTRKPSNADDLDWRIQRLEALRSDQRSRGLAMPRQYEELLQGYLDKRLSRDTGVSQGRMGQLVDAREKAQSELRENDYGFVSVTQIDPDDSPPPARDATEFKNEASRNFSRAMKFISEHGYDIGSYQDRDRALQALEIAEKTLRNGREDGLSDDWIWEDMEMSIDEQFRLR